MTLGGSARPIAASAARTRSRLSATALSGRPTMVNVGRPDGQLDLHLDGAGFEAEIGDSGDGRGHQAPPPNMQRWSEFPLARRSEARPLRTLPASGLRERASCDHIDTHDDAGTVAEVHRQSGGRMGAVRARRPADHRRPRGRRHCPGPGGIFLDRARPRADPQDQHVGQAALCAVQALAAEGRALDGLGAAAAEREAARGDPQGRRNAAEPAIDLRGARPLSARTTAAASMGGPFSFIRT